MPSRKLNKVIIVAWSGGVTSAWCGGWALRTYQKDQVVFLWHDTKEEDEDTYRFSRDMGIALDHPITERSDGRSVTELMVDNNCLASDMRAFCSRILKQEQRQRYVDELRASGVNNIELLLGFGRNERRRIQRSEASSWDNGYKCRFPIAENNISKQQAADWCKSLGVCLPRMYEWSDHANCVGCVRGGKQYWFRVMQHRPDVFHQRLEMEQEFGGTFMNGTSLLQLKYEGIDLRRRKEQIEVGSCECGD